VNDSSENIFRRSFWTGVVDARPPALLRIGLGLLAVADLFDRLRDFNAFYTLDGLVAGLGESMRMGINWTLFSLTAGRGATLALFLGGFPLALAFALGYRTRIANVLLWMFVVSLHNRNPYVCDGGDAVMQALLFWSMFVDTGAVFSLDVRLGRRARSPTIAAFPFRALQLQIALIYLTTFIAKDGRGWREGTAVFQAVSNSDWGRGLGPWLASHPALCRVLTWATLAIEASFPFLVLSPFRTKLTRTVAIAGGVALHTGIFLTMRIGIFSQVMPLSYLVFVPLRWIDAGEAAFARATARWRWLREKAAADRPARPPSPAWGRATAVVAAAVLALIAVDQVRRIARIRSPRAFTALMTLVSQQQNWSMFAPDPPRIDITWRVPGVLTDGSREELTEAVVPELASRDGFVYSRWHRLRNSLNMNPPDLLWPFGRYVCRRARLHHATSGARLARFELVAHVRPLINEAPAAPREQVHYKQSCLAAGQGL
jgi:vitamin K-dependent gamma-carboxylase-like protein